MLNILLERALQNHSKQTDSSQPIFTFSYSTRKKDQKDIKHIHKQEEVRKNNKTDKNLENGLITWKSKTIQKLQNFNLNNPQSAIANIWARQAGMKTNKKCKSALNSPQCKKKLNIDTQYVIKNSQPHRSLKSPLGKTLYLKYKQVQSQKINQKMRFSSLNARSSTTQRGSRTSGSFFIEPKQIQCSNYQMDQQKKFQTSNANFLNTIQYLRVPREEILQRKSDDIENRKKSMRQTRRKVRKNIALEINNSQPFEKVYEQSFPLEGDSHKQSSDTKREKGAKFYIRFSTKRTQKKFQCYRPWSPIKTNPLHFDDQELMLQTFTETIKRKSFQSELADNQMK